MLKSISLMNIDEVDGLQFLGCLWRRRRLGSSMVAGSSFLLFVGLCPNNPSDGSSHQRARSAANLQTNLPHTHALVTRSR